MPSLVLSKQSDAKFVVGQRAYQWFSQEQVQQIESTTWECNDFVGAEIERQLELFSQVAVVDDYAAFECLRQRWHSERGATSSIMEIVLCPAYQSIIGMGQKAVGLILAELESEGDDPDHWFWALQVLTNANPVSEEDEGNLRRMSRTWLAWAKTEGYAW
jgi:hypothetical protein